MAKIAEPVAVELSKVLNMRPKEDETPEAYAERMARKANDISDDDWGTLSNGTQVWVNEALGKIENGAKPPIPEGFKELGALPPPKKPKTPKAPKQPKKAGEVTVEKGVRPGPKGNFDLTSVINLKDEANPHREGTMDHGKFAKIKSGMTVGAVLEAGVERSYLRYLIRLDKAEIRA